MSHISNFVFDFGGLEKIRWKCFERMWYVFLQIKFSLQCFCTFILSRKKRVIFSLRRKPKKEAANRQRPELTRIITSNLLKCKTFLYVAADFTVTEYATQKNSCFTRFWIHLCVYIGINYFWETRKKIFQKYAHMK